MKPARALPVLLLFAAALSQAQTTPFDGIWAVTMHCPPHADVGDDAKGYTHRFPGQVVGGEFSGTHGTEGEPGWHFLHGPIGADGQAMLRLEGIVNNPDYSINQAQRGKRYSYRVKAKFEAGSGNGRRVTGRACDFTFTR